MDKHMDKHNLQKLDKANYKRVIQVPTKSRG